MRFKPFKLINNTDTNNARITNLFSANKIGGV